MGDLGQKFVFWNLQPHQQKRIIARDTQGEGSWTEEICKLALENTNNLGQDRDSEMHDILNEELEL